MKKFLFTFIIAMIFAVSAKGQLAEGSEFPDFTLTSISGQRLHLYGLLDSGFTVFIDISATWCPICWNYHLGHHLDSLYEQHGPAGWSGVNSTTTNDVAVIFFQGEPTSHLAELYGNTAAGAILYTGTETPYSTISQGNWVATTPFPIVDDTTSTDPSFGTNALDATWEISYFPTIYMVCSNHLVHVMDKPTAIEAYDSSHAKCINTAAVPKLAAGDEVTIYPNPARNLTVISLTLNETTHMSVQLSNVLGRILTNVEQDLNAGSHQIELPIETLPSGLYNAKIIGGTINTIKRLTIIN